MRTVHTPPYQPEGCGKIERSRDHADAPEATAAGYAQTAVPPMPYRPVTSAFGNRGKTPCKAEELGRAAIFEPHFASFWVPQVSSTALLADQGSRPRRC